MFLAVKNTKKVLEPERRDQWSDNQESKDLLDGLPLAKLGTTGASKLIMPVT